MARPKIPVITRLLTKIQVPGIPNPACLEAYTEIPIADWPPELTEPQWRWVGGVANARTCVNRVKGVPYLSARPTRPSFVVDGKRVPVHRLMYSLFTGRKEIVRYRTRPTAYLDVNPAHWLPSDHRPPQRETAEAYNDRLMESLIEIIHHRVAVGKHLTKDLIECGFTEEQIIAALIAVDPPTLRKYLTRTPEGSYAITPHEEGRS